MAIKIKKSHKGLLHKNLGVPEGEKIPASKLKIKSTDSKAIRKRKQFAINAKKFKHENGGLMKYENGGNPLYNPNYYDFNQPYYDENQVNNKSKFDPSLNFLPSSGNKYLNRGMQYLNQGLNHFANINSKDYKQPLNYYNGNVGNPLTQYTNPITYNSYNGEKKGVIKANGGKLKKAATGLNFSYQDALQGNTNQYSTEIQQFDVNGYPISTKPSNTSFSQPLFNQEEGQFNSSQFPQDTQKQGGQDKFNSIMQGVAGVTNTIQSGINFGKGAIDIIGTQNQNRQEQLRNAQQYTQSVFSQAIDDRPLDYVTNRNALYSQGGIVHAPEMKGYFRKRKK